MYYQEILLDHESLKDSVLCFWQMQGTVAEKDSLKSRYLPKGQSHLIFNFGDPISALRPLTSPKTETDFFIVPAFNSSLILEQSREIDLYGLSFHGAGLFHLFNKPIKELNGTIPAELHSLYCGLFRQLEGKDFETKNKLLQSFLLRHLKPENRSDKLDKALKLIAAARGNIQINAICDQINISERQLQRLFKQRIGLAPKDYCKITRVNKYLEYIFQSNIKPDWMDLVVAFNYHDQSHLINELKSIAQLSPNKLIELRDTLYHRYKQP